jgi:hypothetical protein
MAQDWASLTGTSKAYKGTKGGVPAESGPFVGIVKNNNDPTRSGRLQVFIESFGGLDSQDEQEHWRTVSYLSPFYGITPTVHTPQQIEEGVSGPGKFAAANRHSYGMWFTPPDVDTRIICIFVDGNPNEGFYVGCIPEPGLTHMVPAIGATENFVKDESKKKVADISRVPTVEITELDAAFIDDPRYYDKQKPIHDVLFGELFSQGTISDIIRGPVGSNSQRESPSTVYGISTPGEAIKASEESTQVIGRTGGHSFIMDDGDFDKKDKHIRLRSSTGHQILLSDNGECLYIQHANGQAWLELGKEGTLDVFSTNSVNVRTQGTINLHADKEINMFAGSKINLNAPVVGIEGDSAVELKSAGSVKLHGGAVHVNANGTLACKGSSVSINGGSKFVAEAGCILLNSGGASGVDKITGMTKTSLTDSTFGKEGEGWIAQPGVLQSIVTRAPTHEPWGQFGSLHNKGVEGSVDSKTSAEPEEEKDTDGAKAGDEAKDISPDPEVILTQEEVTEGDDAIKDAPEIKNEDGDVVLNKDKVKSLLGNLVKGTGQNANELSLDKGIGAFGLSPTDLELGGILKPDVVSRFLQNPSAIVQDGFGADITKLESVLTSPSIFTGAGGLKTLTDLTENASKQVSIAGNNLVKQFDFARSQGFINGNESDRNIGGILLATTKHGRDTATQFFNGTANSTNRNAFLQTIRNGQHSIDLVNQRVAGTTTSTAFNPRPAENTFKNVEEQVSKISKTFLTDGRISAALNASRRT